MSTEAAITKQLFIMFNPPPECKDPYEQRRLLPILGLIDDYNHFIGGVNIADQLRSSYTTQQRARRVWKPYFFWLLDTTIINAFLLSEHLRKASLDLKKVRSAHRDFRLLLV